MNDTFARFVDALLDTGKVTVDEISGETTTAEEYALVRQSIREFETSYRLDLPATPPALDLDVAVWAAEVIYRVCQLVSYRQYGIEHLSQYSTGTRLAPSIETDYSVDIFFRFLPSLARHAKTIAQEDPLLEFLVKLGNEYPLSSVGMTNCPAKINTQVLGHECLRKLYIDRVIRRSDTGRIETAVAEHMRFAVSEYDDTSSISQAVRTAVAKSLEPQGPSS